jgi:hypothetical protein
MSMSSALVWGGGGFAVSAVSMWLLLASLGRGRR